MAIPARTGAARSVSLTKYRLGRIALDLRTFTVAELESFAQVPVNTVYSFLHRLGPGVVAETLATRASDRPGRPAKRYSLTREGVERLVEENLETAQLLRTEGVEAPARAASVEPAQGEPSLARGGAVAGPSLEVESASRRRSGG